MEYFPVNVGNVDGGNDMLFGDDLLPAKRAKLEVEDNNEGSLTGADDSDTGRKTNRLEKFKANEEVSNAIDNFQQETGTNYVVQKTEKEFGNNFDVTKHTILFEDRKSNEYESRLEFNGVPFIVVGRKDLECTHGVDHKKKDV